jgi:hypothetical protein
MPTILAVKVIPAVERPGPCQIAGGYTDPAVLRQPDRDVGVQPLRRSRRHGTMAAGCRVPVVAGKAGPWVCRREGVCGPEHPDTLHLRGNLAYWTG